MIAKTFLFLTLLALTCAHIAQGYQHVAQESLVVLRVNRDPLEHVLHYHGAAPEPHAEPETHDAASRNLRHQVRMHTNQPVTDIKAKEGDLLTIVHSSFPADVARVTVPRIGVWFAATFPVGSSLSEAGAVIRMMLVQQGGVGSEPQLITNDYDEWVVDNNAANLGTVLPADFKAISRSSTPEERKRMYQTMLGARFPMPPMPEEEEKDL